MHGFDEEFVRDTDAESQPTRSVPAGKSTLTSRLAPSATSIARAVVKAMRAGEAPTVEPDAARPTLPPLTSGQPLDPEARSFAERGFGHDFSAVRVHTGDEAALAASDLGARAFAHGNDLVFGSGEYSPQTSAGRWLLAHELAHVVQQGGQPATTMRKPVLGDEGDGFERAADAAADRVMAGEAGVGASMPRGAPAIRRFTGRLPWGSDGAWYSLAPNRYEINGTVVGGGGRAAITGERVTLNINAGTSGVITLTLDGTYAGVAGGSALTRSVAQGTFRLTQTFPFRCTPEGVITVDTAAMVPGTATNDPSHMTPFGIGESEMGVSFAANSDGSTYLAEGVTFSSGGGGASVSVGPIGVNSGGGTTNTHTVPIRINLNVLGARPAAPAPAPRPATATATATATAPMPVRVTPPPPHAVYFRDERQTEGDEGALVAWATGLPQAAQDALRDHRLSCTVIGYASTTGDDHTNFERYSRQRAEWVQRVLARALAVDPSAFHVGWRGEYTAPAADRAAPGGVPSAAERRVDVTFAEAAPMTTAPPVTATATATSGTPAP